LIVIEKPETRGQLNDRQNWLGFEHRVQGIAGQYKSIERLSENVFLIPLNSALPSLEEVLEAAATQKLAYRILLLEEPLEWNYSSSRSHPSAASDRKAG